MKYQGQSIQTLVELLPEVYQPIFKHPEFTAQASRSCSDRLEKITAIYDYISTEKGRPLKVLDLGCAQGFFSLNLAERGATVTAVDYSQPNINMCKKLASENSSFKIEFILGSIETIIKEKIVEQEYDLVLGLSVFHHIVYEHGADYVFDLFSILSKKVETGIFEFALNTEPLYWADAQPEEPRKLVDFFSFNHQLSTYGTHLSDVVRPFYFSSNKYWHVDSHFGVVDRFTDRSHEFESGYHAGSRRYYFSDNKLIKIVVNKNDNESNHIELENEALFLEKPLPGFRMPNLVTYGSRGNETWLVRELIPGKLLLDIILDSEDYDDQSIIESILEQTAVLEKNSLYHNDFRPWNIVIGDDKQVYIIDFGSISEHTKDGDDIYGQILSFFVVIREIAQHQIRQKGSQRPLFVVPENFPEKYRPWLNRVWQLPSQKWSFVNIFAAYQSEESPVLDIPVSAIVESQLSTATNFISWKIKSLQEQIDQEISHVGDDFQGTFQQLLTKVEKSDAESQNAIFQLYSQLEELNKKIDTIAIQHDTQIAEQVESVVTTSEQTTFIDELNNQKLYVGHLRHELNLVYNSRSWKLTYPLRLLSKIVSSIFKPRKLIAKLKSYAKKKLKGLVTRLSTFITSRPLLKQRVIRLLNKYPGLKYRLKRRLLRVDENNHPSSVVENVAITETSPEIVSQEQNNTVKKTGALEKQKSVLESWFY